MRVHSFVMNLLFCIPALAGPLDTDGDGIEDANDECANTPHGVPVDEHGRPIADLDRDCDVDIEDFQVFQRSLTDYFCTPEICDGIDNNCNGSIDEGFDVGSPCGIGQCAGGVVECVPDGSGGRCDTQPGGSHDRSSAEICDGLDNDCDGAVDEQELCAYGCALSGGGCFHPDTCSSPYVISGPDFGPVTFVGDLADYSNDVTGSCGGAGSDVIHRVGIPPEGANTGFATIVLNSTGSAVDTMLHLTAVCGDSGQEPTYTSVVCGASIGAGRACANTVGTTEILRACGMPGGTYFATLDSAASSGAFALSLAVKSVNLDTCAEAGNISGLPAVVASTVGKANQYSYNLTGSLGCLGGALQNNACGQPNGDPSGNRIVCGSDGGANGADIVFYYIAMRTGFLTIDTEGSDFDTVLYIKTACTQNCIQPSDCRACNDDHNIETGQSWSRIYRFPVTAGTLYYIMVDGFGGVQGTVHLNGTFSTN